MNHPISERSVGSLVASDYRYASVFRTYRIDFCCGGASSLNDVCAEQDLDLNEVVTALEAVSKGADTTQNHDDMTTQALIELIKARYHSYVRESIPTLVEFTKKVSMAHGERKPYVNDIADTFVMLAQELIDHMAKEEQMLFPAIETWLSDPSDAHLERIHSLIAELEQEHDTAGDLMHRIRALATDYDPPTGACMTHRVSYGKLEEFELQLHEHVHLENNVLFQRIPALEGHRLN